MPLSDPRQPDFELRQLDRRSTWMWGCSALVMIVLGATVSVVYLTQVASGPDLYPAAETRGLLAGGLCGVVALFSLYVLIKHAEAQRLRSQLIEARLREESLSARLLGLSTLLDGITHVAMHLDLEVVLAALVEHVRTTLRADQVSIMLLDPETSELECRAVCGMDTEFVRGARVKMGQGISGWVAHTQKSVVLNRDEMVSRFPAHEKPGRNITTALCVPLAIKEQVIGVLNINRLGSAAPFTHEDARVLTVFGAHAALAIQRIAEKQHDEQVREVQKMEALGRLAGGIAHDFNNLLTVILSYAATVEAKLGIGHALLGAVEKIRHAGERCASLTRQLLAFGRKQIVRPEALDLNASVRNLTDLLHRVVREDVELVTRLAPELDPIQADPGQIDQVVVNLVLNGRDAMPEGGLLVLETSCAELDATRAKDQGVPPGRYVMLTVTDTGRGMDAEAQKHAFEPFYNAKHPIGTGLGLATVHAIVKQTGGHISVSSEPGGGSIFQLLFPSHDAQTSSRPRFAALQGRLRRDDTILLLEDEEVVRDLAREILELGGYRVLCARRGIEALRIADVRHQPIDLLLSDVILPGMSGPEVAERLGRERPQMKVLYMSGYTGDELDSHGILESGASFIQKPFTPEGLLAAVRQALEASPGAQDGSPEVEGAA